MELHKEIDRLLPVIGRGIIEASRAILEVYEGSISVEKKEDDSPLTLADRRSHEILKATLAGCRIGTSSSIPILSEEGRNIPYTERADWDSFWLVDPLDGTKEFIKKNGEFTINIALLQKAAPVFGLIYVPVQDLLYFGGPGRGAYRLGGLAETGGKIDPADAEALPGTAPGDAAPPSDAEPGETAADQRHAVGPLRIVASRSHRNADTDAFVDRLRSAISPSRGVEIVSAGSALKFCRRRICRSLSPLCPLHGMGHRSGTCALCGSRMLCV
jgi:3'(2'), 5'-bisphosphate nucleotidase